MVPAGPCWVTTTVMAAGKSPDRGTRRIRREGAARTTSAPALATACSTVSPRTDQASASRPRADPAGPPEHRALVERNPQSAAWIFRITLAKLSRPMYLTGPRAVLAACGLWLCAASAVHEA